jgi:hypothetical protein
LAQMHSRISTADNNGSLKGSLKLWKHGETESKVSSLVFRESARIMGR